jgi:hypothetical protein
MKKNRGWTWWCHHGMMLEYCTDFADRVDYVKTHKLKSEIPARLNAFRFVKGKLPTKFLKAYKTRKKASITYDKAYAAYCKAYMAYDKAHVAYGEAYTAYNEAYAASQPQIRALFEKECPDIEWDKNKEVLKF